MADHRPLTPGPSSAGSAPASASAKSAKVEIKDFKFLPAKLTVRTGAKVAFANDDKAPHTATVDEGDAFDTGTLNQGDTKTITLSKPGTYAYHCDFHRFMTGTITVR